MPASGGELVPLTQDKASDLDPAWSPDGEYLFFSSDRGGINNLYAYSLGDGKFFKVTNVTTGAFAPVVSPNDRKIAYVGYSIEGYDLRIMNFDPTSWKEVELTKEELPKWPGWPHADLLILPYSPWSSLRPKLWLPFVTPEGAGFVTFGVDYLFHHDYLLVTGYDWQNNKLFSVFNYTTHSFWPILSIELEGGAQGSRQRLGVTLPLVDKLASSQALSLSYESRASFGDFITASWNFSRRQGFDLFRDERKIGIEGKLGRVGDDFYRQLVLDWRERLDLPLEQENELTFKLIHGWSNLTENFKLGGNEGRFMLRGFAPGVLRGSQALAGSLEYRFSIAHIERGIGLWPLFLNWVKGSLFFDLGMAGEKIDWNRFKLGFGGELRPQIILGYGFPLELRLGIAQGLGEKKPSFYIAIGTAF
jgi:hypothetical protein